MPCRRTVVISYLLLFSAGYALFELFAQPCRMLPWCSPRLLLGLPAYQYVFMLPLFGAIAFLPVRRELLCNSTARRTRAVLLGSANLLASVLAEDILFFLFAASPIRPGLFTTQWGYFEMSNLVVPIWYPVFLVLIVFLILLARRTREIDSDEAAHEAQRLDRQANA